MCATGVVNRVITLMIVELGIQIPKVLQEDKVLITSKEDKLKPKEAKFNLKVLKLKGTIGFMLFMGDKRLRILPTLSPVCYKYLTLMYMLSLTPVPTSLLFLLTLP